MDFKGNCACEGEQGPTGATGATGAAGPEGATGATGPTEPEATGTINTNVSSVTLMDYSKIVQYPDLMVISFRALLTLTASTNFFNGTAIVLGSYDVSYPAPPTYVATQAQYTESGVPPTIQNNANVVISTGSRTIQLTRGDGDSTVGPPSDPLYVSGTLVFTF
jgi:hypothetical protein